MKRPWITNDSNDRVEGNNLFILYPSIVFYTSLQKMNDAEVRALLEKSVAVIDDKIKKILTLDHRCLEFEDVRPILESVFETVLPIVLKKKPWYVPQALIQKYITKYSQLFVECFQFKFNFEKNKPEKNNLLHNLCKSIVSSSPKKSISVHEATLMLTELLVPNINDILSRDELKIVEKYFDKTKTKGKSPEKNFLQVVEKYKAISAEMSVDVMKTLNKLGHYSTELQDVLEARHMTPTPSSSSRKAGGQSGRRIRTTTRRRKAIGRRLSTSRRRQ